MGTGRRIAIVLAAAALMLWQAMPAAWASGSGRGGEKSQTEQKAPTQSTGAQTVSDEQEAECPPPESTTPTDPAAGTTATGTTTASTCEESSGPKADVNLTGHSKAVEHNPNVDANGQLVPGTAGDQAKPGTETEKTKAEAQKAKAAAEEQVAKVKAESRVQAKQERAKGEKGAYLVYVDGKRLNLTPLAHNGRTLVPFRRLAEFLGAQVSWDPSTQTVTMVKGDSTVTLSIGSTTATVNGETVEVQVPPELVEGSTFVPLRFIASALGADVDYDAETGAITVITIPATPPADGSGTTGGTTDGTTTGGTTTGGTTDGTTTGGTTNSGTGN